MRLVSTRSDLMASLRKFVAGTILHSGAPGPLRKNVGDAFAPISLMTGDSQELGLKLFNTFDHMHD